MPQKSIRKVLVLQTAFPGDVVLATPLARGIKEAVPEADVHFLVIPQSAILLKNNPFIKKVWVYDKRGRDRGVGSFISLIRQIRNAHFDTAVVPHRSLRSAILVWAAKIPCRVGFRKSAGACLFTDVVSYPTQIHEVDRNFQLLQALGVERAVSDPELFPGPEELEIVDQFLMKAGIDRDQKCIAMAPGSIWPTKRWPPESFARVAHKLWEDKQILSILVGGEKDAVLGDQILRMTQGVVSAMGRLSLLESAELIRRCCAILTNDSAPLHLGAAMGTPVVAIFGPTVPAFGFGPYGEGHRVVEKELDCRPCGIHGGKRCRKGHFDCMRSITSQDVLRILEETVS